MKFSADYHVLVTIVLTVAAFFTVVDAADPKLLSPRNGTIWIAGRREKITWNATYTQKDGKFYSNYTRITLQLLEAGSNKLLFTIGENLPFSLGSVEWDVPDNVTVQRGFFYRSRTEILGKLDDGNDYCLFVYPSFFDWPGDCPGCRNAAPKGEPFRILPASCLKGGCGVPLVSEELGSTVQQPTRSPSFRDHWTSVKSVGIGVGVVTSLAFLVAFLVYTKRGKKTWQNYRRKRSGMLYKYRPPVTAPPKPPASPALRAIDSPLGSFFCETEEKSPKDFSDLERVSREFSHSFKNSSRFASAHLSQLTNMDDGELESTFNPESPADWPSDIPALPPPALLPSPPKSHAIFNSPSSYNVNKNTARDEEEGQSDEDEDFDEDLKPSDFLAALQEDQEYNFRSEEMAVHMRNQRTLYDRLQPKTSSNTMASTSFAPMNKSEAILLGTTFRNALRVSLNNAIGDQKPSSIRSSDYENEQDEQIYQRQSHNDQDSQNSNPEIIPVGPVVYDKSSLEKEHESFMQKLPDGIQEEIKTGCSPLLSQLGYHLDVEDPLDF